MRSKGLIIIIILLVIILLILSPWLAGLAFKHNYYRLVAAINQNPNSPITLQILNYQLGYSTSHAKLRMTSSPQFQAKLQSKAPANTTPSQTQAALNSAMNMPLDIDQTIQHGPIVTNSVTNRKVFAYGNIRSDINIPLEAGMTGGQIKINTLCKIGNKWANNFAMPNFSVSDNKNNKNFKFMLQNITGFVNFKLRNQALDALDFNLSADSINLQDSTQNNTQNNTQNITQNITHSAPYSFQMTNFKTDMQGNLSSSGLWNTVRSLRFDRILLKLTDGSTFQASNFSSVGETQDKAVESNQHAYSVKTEFTLNQLTTPSKLFPVIGPINYDFTINNLNSQAIKQISDLFQESSQNPNNYNLYKQFVGYAIIAIRPDTTITSHTLIKTPQGDFSVNINISWAGATINNLYDIISDAGLELNLSAGVNLVNNTIDEVTRLLPANAPSAAQPVAPVQLPAAVPTTTTSTATTTVAPIPPEITTVTTPPLETQTAPTKELPTATPIETNRHPIVKPLETNAVAPNALSTQTTTTTTKTTTQTQPVTGPKPTAPQPASVLTPQQKAEQVKAYIAQAVEKGYIIIKDNNYIVNIIRSKGQFTINGQDIRELMKIPELPISPGPVLPAPTGGTTASLP